MNLLKILKKAAVFVYEKQDSLFSYDLNKQLSYISHFNDPVDDIERSYFQYMCQMKLSGTFIKFLLNFVSIFLIPIYLIKLRKMVIKDALTNINAIFFTDGKPKNILPLELLEEFPNIVYENNENSYYLSKSDMDFTWMLIKRYPLSYYFILKCVMKIARYSATIKQYSPRAIVVCTEYSFTSSVLTAYCETQNLKHINVMHGEKLFYMRDSFFRFHECYIWDNFYKDLFIQLRAEPKQWIVALPQSINFCCNDIVEKKYDFTYYLAFEQESELMTIGTFIKKLSDKGYNISVRPHPRYTDLKLVNEIFAEYQIENHKNLTIEESVKRTKRAISLYSTVLNQAFRNGVEVVIDDLTNPQKYNNLIDLQYVILSKKHTLLSKFFDDKI